MSRISAAAPAIATAPLGPVHAEGGPLKLREANLWRGQLAGADLRDADLQRCSLVLADLSGADLRGARLTNCDLGLADLRGADLRGADLHAADLTGADLRGARLDGADTSDVELAGAQIDGAVGAPDAWLQLPRLGDRVAYALDNNGEPQQARRAFERSQRAWQQGRFFAAERHLQQARAWLGDSDLVDWHLGALALELHDPFAALEHWQRAVATHDRADRARLDLALLLLASDQREAAVAALNVEKPLWFADIAAQLRQGADDAAITLVIAKLGTTPGLKWLRRPAPRQPVAVRDDDAEAMAAERANLVETLADPRQPAWVWHAAIARALAIGDLELAQRADQRLLAVAPDHRLWGLQLRQLDVTAQAFTELARTRAPTVGTPQRLRWVALGAHGPTARLSCNDQEFYAKRYDGTTRPVPSVAYTHRIARALADRGLHVPVAMGDASGDDIMVFGNDLLALYPNVGGQPLDSGPDTAGYVSNHRFQITDAIPFERSMAALIELWAHRPTPGLSYARIAYHYARPGAVDDHRALMPSDLKLPVLPKRMPEAAGGAEGATIHLAAKLGAQATSGAVATVPCAIATQLELVQWHAEKGAELKLRVPIAKAGRTTLHLVALHSPEGATLQATIGGKALVVGDKESIVSLRSPHAQRVLNVAFLALDLPAGEQELVLKCVEPGVVGLDYCWIISR